MVLLFSCCTPAYNEGFEFIPYGKQCDMTVCQSFGEGYVPIGTVTVYIASGKFSADDAMLNDTEGDGLQQMYRKPYFREATMERLFKFADDVVYRNIGGDGIVNIRTTQRRVGLKRHNMLTLEGEVVRRIQ